LHPKLKVPNEVKLHQEENHKSIITQLYYRTAIVFLHKTNLHQLPTVLLTQKCPMKAKSAKSSQIKMKLLGRKHDGKNIGKTSDRPDIIQRRDKSQIGKTRFPNLHREMESS
jgi:hypothetical protein